MKTIFGFLNSFIGTRYEVNCGQPSMFPSTLELSFEVTEKAHVVSVSQFTELGVQITDVTEELISLWSAQPKSGLLSFSF